MGSAGCQIFRNWEQPSTARAKSLGTDVHKGSVSQNEHVFLFKKRKGQGRGLMVHVLVNLLAVWWNKP